MGKKVVDIACGSLHCIVCTEDGKVFAWGDNDEGQIGNDSTMACRDPQVSACNVVFSFSLSFSQCFTTSLGASYP